MNQPDGSWNFGESPYGIDRGGVLEPDPLMSPPATPNFVPLTSNGWAPYPNEPLLQHYVGSFRPPVGVGVGPYGETRASFEVVAPISIPANKKIVVAMFTRPTSGPTVPADTPYAPHVYPGNPAWFDLMADGPGGGHVDNARRYAAGMNPDPPFRIVGVQHVPRTTTRPVVFELQRLRQTRMAVLHLLTQPPYSRLESDIAFYVDCGSFGGFTAPLAALYYPKEFHAATGYAFTGALRSMQSDFDSLQFFTSLLGADHSGSGYLMRDALEFPMWCSVEDTDFASASFTNRWARGHVQRPTYFVLGDEDMVSHGTDWIQILLGASSNSLVQPDSGHATRQNASLRQVEVLWSIISKTGHSEPRLNVFTLQGVTPPVQTTDLSRVFDVMVARAYDELARPPVEDIDTVGRKLTNQSSLPSLDPSGPALAHGGNRVYAGGSNANLLAEAGTFKRYGQGTWLGANESLKVKQLPGHDRASVFVGSADGYVTRLVMEGRPLASPTIHPLVEKARSKLTNGAPYALGHGTWGIDVGDIDPAAGWEVAVGSYDKVAIFDAANLTLIREVTLPSWEYTSPRKLQIADLLDDSLGEIVFRTLHGHLVVMDRNLAIRYEHREGGIIDLAIGPAPQPRNQWLKRPIYLLSARGHVVRLEMDTTNDMFNAGVLAGASPLQYGGLRDLDVVPYNGQDQLAALFIAHPRETSAIRFFSFNDCSLAGGFGNVVLPPPPPEEGLAPTSLIHANPGGDMEPSFTYVAGHGADRYVISCSGEISVWDGSEWFGFKKIGSFRPAGGHGCVQAGDVDPSRAGDEVVVATTAGRLVWFTLDDLTTPGLEIDAPNYARTATRFVTDPADGLVYEDRCNMSLAATWAMSAVPANGSTPGRLLVVDPAGVWWELDRFGKPTWVRDLLGSAWSLLAAEASNLGLGSGGSLHTEWQTLAEGTNPVWTFLRSRPFVPSPLSTTGGWWLPQPVGPVDARPILQFLAGYWVLPGGGATYLDQTNGHRWCAWWQNYNAYTNLLQRVTYTVSGGTANVQSVWGSTQDDFLSNGTAPPRWPPGAQGYLNPLRAEYAPVTPMSMQAIAIGKVLQGRTVPQVIASCGGGRVLLLDGSNGRVITEGNLPIEAPDYGLGGMALAVSDLTGDGYDDVVFAPLYNPIAGAGGTVRSHIHVLKSNPAGDGLVPVSPTAPPVPVAGSGPADDLIGYGACGMAILDLPTTPPISKAIVVTTMNGELVVFTQTNGVINPAPLYRKIIEGSIGAMNSIVLADIDPGDPKPELYLGGSSGVRRFDFQ